MEMVVAVGNKARDPYMEMVCEEIKEDMKNIEADSKK